MYIFQIIGIVCLVALVLCLVFCALTNNRTISRRYGNAALIFTGLTGLCMVLYTTFR